MGDFPQTKGGVYAFLIKRAKAKKELMPFFFLDAYTWRGVEKTRSETSRPLPRLRGNHLKKEAQKGVLPSCRPSNGDKQGPRGDDIGFVSILARRDQKNPEKEKRPAPSH